MTNTVTITGVPLHIGTDAECEACDYVVCGDPAWPSPFTDNVHTTCALCGHPVIHRPHVPKTPPKICLTCMVDLAKAENGKAN